MADLQTCPACFQVNQAQAQSCPRCHEVLVRCRQCGLITAGGFSHCHACGHPLPVPDRPRQTKTPAQDRPADATTPAQTTAPDRPVRPKGFIGRFFLTLVAYLVLPLGLALNLVFLSAARKLQPVTGRFARGTTGLVILLVIAPLVWIGLIAAAVVWLID
jgi:hypothetical protein